MKANQTPASQRLFIWSNHTMQWDAIPSSNQTTTDCLKTSSRTCRWAPKRYKARRTSPKGSGEVKYISEHDGLIFSNRRPLNPVVTNEAFESTKGQPTARINLTRAREAIPIEGILHQPLCACTTDLSVFFFCKVVGRTSSSDQTTKSTTQPQETKTFRVNIPSHNLKQSKKHTHTQGLPSLWSKQCEPGDGRQVDST